MEFRPVTKELLEHCASTEYCTDCKYRIGCGIRRDFYVKRFEKDIDFELLIQTLEITASKQFGKTIAFMGTEHVRRKFYRERALNPVFSYV